MTISDVHTSHCCPRFGCKYGDEDCIVATGEANPEYPCEDCTCLFFNKDAAAESEKWWKTLSDGAKATIYLHNSRG